MMIDDDDDDDDDFGFYEKWPQQAEVEAPSGHRVVRHVHILGTWSGFQKSRDRSGREMHVGLLHHCPNNL